MKEFKKWLKKNKPYGVYSCMDMAGKAWKAALEFYKDTAARCERDCTTDKDYKILYFHLKQVLKNELNL